MWKSIKKKEKSNRKRSLLAEGFSEQLAPVVDWVGARSSGDSSVGKVSLEGHLCFPCLLLHDISP